MKQLIPLVVYKITWSFNFGDLESRDKFPRFDIRTAIQCKRPLNNSFARRAINIAFSLEIVHCPIWTNSYFSVTWDGLRPNVPSTIERKSVTSRYHGSKTFGSQQKGA